MKKIIPILSLVLFLIVVFPVIVYTIHFHSFTFSDSTEIWAKFGDYLNGSLSPIIAIVGIMITLSISIYSEQNKSLSNEKLEMQQRPFLYITYSDFESRLNINILNKGIGPLIITEYNIKNNKLKVSYSSIFECISNIGGNYDNYTSNQNGLVLSPGDEINLFSLTDKQPDFQKMKIKVRKLFADLEFEIKYCDVYGKEMPKYTRKLEWFGRNLD